MTTSAVDDSKRDGWRPLVRGESAAHVWRTIHEIADGLERASTDLDRDPSLGRGAAGRSLFYAYLATATGEERYADLATDCVERMIDALPEMPPKPGLYGGYLGPGWTLEHLRGRLVELEEDFFEEIDGALLAALAEDVWRQDYDLISGLVGCGVYALEGRRRAAHGAGLGRLLDHLERLAESRAGQTTWWTPPELLPEHQRRAFPRGYYNLGVAHGVPGIAALLAALVAGGWETERSRRLLEPAVAWIMAQELAPPAAGGFPSFTGEGTQPRPARLAWCYGSLGLATALLKTARLAGCGRWERVARRLARAAAARPLPGAGVVDAGLCHGSAGVGHLFNRLSQATGDETLAQAARTWFGHTLRLQRPGEGIGGFLAWWSPNGESRPRWMPLTGFLEGAAGIGLALLAAVSRITPDWDRVLMTDVAPTANSGSRSRESRAA